MRVQRAVQNRLIQVSQALFGGFSRDKRVCGASRAKHAGRVMTGFLQPGAALGTPVTVVAPGTRPKARRERHVATSAQEGTQVVGHLL